MVKLKSAEIIYPESDGKPIADNTKQFRWIVVIQQNIATISRSFWKFTASRLEVYKSSLSLNKPGF